jgi:hypothetical protein
MGDLFNDRTIKRTIARSTKATNAIDGMYA